MRSPIKIIGVLIALVAAAYLTKATHQQTPIASAASQASPPANPVFPATAAGRKQASAALERFMLGRGVDTYISVSGKDNTTLTVKYVLMSRPAVYQLVNDQNERGFMPMVRDLGFRKLVFTDGFKDTWTVDVPR